MGIRPVIGIAGASYVVARPWGNLPVHGIPRRYAECVVAAGGRPIVLPPCSGHEVLDLLDGLVLAGGGDVDPTLYGPADHRAHEVDHARDAAEILLVQHARAAGVPVLGVCRGAQVLVVTDGGTLDPDLGPRHLLPAGGHHVTTSPGSICDRLLGRRPQVSSLHHQAIHATGPGWRITARAEDGVVEAVEWDASDWLALGVQWHPELDHTGATLFGWLVDMAAQTAGRAGRNPDPWWSPST